MKSHDHPLSAAHGSQCDKGHDPPLFSVRLSAHRSLGRRGFFMLLMVVGGISLVCGLLFLAAGAWPVFGFFGLDFLAIWTAFHLNYRAARAYEEVSVWRHDLLVRKVNPSGRVTEHRFNPFWTRFLVDRHDEIGITRMALKGQGSELPIGSFLNPVDRESFVRAFGGALAAARN
ncbi:MAG: DUF2244 domain-containing protein [Rhizobiaceae bacterium]